jgi:hypothetical protein
MEEFTKDGKRILGSKVVASTLTEFKKEGYWRVTQILTQERLVEGAKDWEVKTVKMSAEAEDKATAIKNAFVSLDTYLAPRNNDLFNEPVIPAKTDDGEYIN